MKFMLSGLFAALMFGASMAWAAVNVNTATQSELETVRGIGPAKARAIVMHREKNGPFKSVDDVAKVKGFGAASLARIKDQITVDAVAAEAAPAAVKKP